MDFRIRKNHQGKLVIGTGILTFIILMFLFYLKKLAPFGTRSFVVMDANIQYLDFLSYYKDVLVGKNSIGYTFGKTLGGSTIAVFSYYLSSPFNFLLIFFRNLDLHIFLDLVVALKLSLAAMAFSFFSINRFDGSENDNIEIYVLTSIGYALCQYNIAQGSNIMWLDGVYMLPFILLQVSNIVRKKDFKSLPFIVGATIIFNWYTAGIDLIFSAFWFLFEFSLYAIDEKVRIKEFIQDVFKYAISMFLGICMSAIIFLPTIGELKKSTRGSLHFEELRKISFLGELPSAIQKYSYAGTSDLGSVALFCGSIAIVLAIFTFFSHKNNIRKRILFFWLFFGSILIFYWKPLFIVFSLFQWVSSYYYRYSYVSIFSILFLAIIGGKSLEKESQIKNILILATIFVAIQLMLSQYKPIGELKYVHYTAIVMLLETIFFVIVKFVRFRNNNLRKILSLSFIIFGIFDISLNTNYLIDRYSVDEVKQYQDYREIQEDIISKVKSEDDSWYRISQTSTRNMLEYNLTANYNEGLSYNYPSISGYTSAPDDIQRIFLTRLGYRINGENMCITNTSILGADSLLSVKYILSKYNIKGLIKKNVENVMGKDTYLNPYAFPVAFTYDKTNKLQERVTNPFEYQNKIYKEIFGLDDELYIPIEYTVIHDKNKYGAKINLNQSDKTNVVLYGSIPWKFEGDSLIYVNGELITGYARWLSPSVFYIPLISDDSDCVVEVRSNLDNFNWDNVQFYALDLNVLKKCSEIANSHKVRNILIKNGKVEISTEKTGERLFLSIPSDTGWSISVNGKAADVELIGDCLYSIKLTDGMNNISMKYHIRFFMLGVIISFASISGYIIYLIIMRNIRKKKVGD